MSYALLALAIFSIISTAIGILLVNFLVRLRADLEASVVWMRSVTLRLEKLREADETSAAQ